MKNLSRHHWLSPLRIVQPQEIDSWAWFLFQPPCWPREFQNQTSPGWLLWRDIFRLRLSLGPWCRLQHLKPWKLQKLWWPWPPLVWMIFRYLVFALEPPHLGRLEAKRTCRWRKDKRTVLRLDFKPQNLVVRILQSNCLCCCLEDSAIAQV